MILAYNLIGSYASWDKTNKNDSAPVFCKLQSLEITTMLNIARRIKRFSSLMISYLIFRYFPAVYDIKFADYISIS